MFCKSKEQNGLLDFIDQVQALSSESADGRNMPQLPDQQDGAD
jgi:hypothetical protein